MFTTAYQKLFKAISQWFEAGQLPVEPELIPIKIHRHESRRRHLRTRKY